MRGRKSKPENIFLLFFKTSLLVFPLPEKNSIDDTPGVPAHISKFWTYTYHFPDLGLAVSRLGLAWWTWGRQVPGPGSRHGWRPIFHTRCFLTNLGG